MTGPFDKPDVSGVWQEPQQFAQSPNSGEARQRLAGRVAANAGMPMPGVSGGGSTPGMSTDYFPDPVNDSQVMPADSANRRIMICVQCYGTTGQMRVRFGSACSSATNAPGYVLDPGDSIMFDTSVPQDALFQARIAGDAYIYVHVVSRV